MSKLWAGRTSGEVSSIADDFNSSIRFDCKLYKQDITGSMAHAAMLGAQGIISQAEAGQLIDGLQGILSDLESGALEFDFGCEDIHMFVEQVLTQRLGDVGKKLHTARSRNDQVALDLRMYLKDQIDEITALVKDVLGAIVAQAENNKGVIMPGYTHLQRAQPILFSHHRRILEQVNVMMKYIIMVMVYASKFMYKAPAAAFVLYSSSVTPITESTQLSLILMIRLFPIWGIRFLSA